MKRLLQEPLVHFLGIGLALFLLFALRGDSGEAKTVIVDRQSLLEFMQSRAQAFTPGEFEDRLDRMSQAQLDAVVSDFVREQVLHREALAIGLERQDATVRQRLAKRLEYMMRGAAGTGAVEEAALRRRFEEDRAAYALEPRVSFLDVFFSKDSRTAAAAWELAVAKLAELNRDGVPIGEIGEIGDRFPGGSEFIGAERAAIERRFGGSLARLLFELEPQEGLWRGPFESPAGFHVVMLRSREQRRIREFEDVRSLVEEDLRQERTTAAVDSAVSKLIGEYDIRIVGGLQSGSEGRE